MGWLHTWEENTNFCSNYSFLCHSCPKTDAAEHLNVYNRPHWFCPWILLLFKEYSSTLNINCRRSPKQEPLLQILHAQHQQIFTPSTYATVSPQSTCVIQKLLIPTAKSPLRSLNVGMPVLLQQCYFIGSFYAQLTSPHDSLWSVLPVNRLQA